MAASKIPPHGLSKKTPLKLREQSELNEFVDRVVSIELQ